MLVLCLCHWTSLLPWQPASHYVKSFSLYHNCHTVHNRVALWCAVVMEEMLYRRLHERIKVVATEVCGYFWGLCSCRSQFSSLSWNSGVVYLRTLFPRITSRSSQTLIPLLKSTHKMRSQIHRTDARILCPQIHSPVSQDKLIYFQLSLKKKKVSNESKTFNGAKNNLIWNFQINALVIILYRFCKKTVNHTHARTQNDFSWVFTGRLKTEENCQSGTCLVSLRFVIKP